MYLQPTKFEGVKIAMNGGWEGRFPLNNSCFMTILTLVQAQYNPCRIEGCGLTDGEVMEQLWSCLRRMAKTTKEMRPSHRIDALTCALLHYGDKSRQKLGMV